MKKRGMLPNVANNASETKNRSIIVMTDGEPTFYSNNI